MRRFIIMAVLAGTGITAQDASATVRSDAHHACQRASDRFGVETVGRRIERVGVQTRHGTRKATRRELREYGATCERMFAPPPAPVVAAPATTAPTQTTAPATVAPASTGTATTGGASGGYTIPESIVQCESHGDYGAVNPSSGAYGAYQIMPSTSAALGCDMSTASGQDQCAAKVWATQGRGAWSC